MVVVMVEVGTAVGKAVERAVVGRVAALGEVTVAVGRVAAPGVAMAAMERKEVTESSVVVKVGAAKEAEQVAVGDEVGEREGRTVEMEAAVWVVVVTAAKRVVPAGGA